MGVIDFTDMQKRNKAYAGANGKKISVLYDGEQYMLKFPSIHLSQDCPIKCYRAF